VAEAFGGIFLVALEPFLRFFSGTGAEILVLLEPEQKKSIGSASLLIWVQTGSKIPLYRMCVNGYVKIVNVYRYYLYIIIFKKFQIISVF